MQNLILMSVIRVATILCILSLANQSCAAEQILVCPSKIDASHVKLTYAEDGWTPFVESHLRLTSVSFMDGPPEKIGHLKPLTTSKYKKNDSDTFTFEGNFPNGKWLSCLYDGTQISLSKKIDDALRVCVVTQFKEKKYGRNSFEINCK